MRESLTIGLRFFTKYGYWPKKMFAVTLHSQIRNSDREPARPTTHLLRNRHRIGDNSHRIGDRKYGVLGSIFYVCYKCRATSVPQSLHYRDTVVALP